MEGELLQKMNQIKDRNKNTKGVLLIDKFGLPVEKSQGSFDEN